MRRERLELRNKIKSTIMARTMDTLRDTEGNTQTLNAIYDRYAPLLRSFKEDLARTYGYEDVSLMDYEHSVKALEGMCGR